MSLLDYLFSSECHKNSSNRLRTVAVIFSGGQLPRLVTLINDTSKVK